MVVADLEAGAGTMLRLGDGPVDVAVVVTEPTEKSLEVAGRLVELSAARAVAQVIVVANRVSNDADVEHVRRTLGVDQVTAVPDDPAIRRADREGLAPLDAEPSSPAVLALVSLAERLGSAPAVAG